MNRMSIRPVNVLLADDDVDCRQLMCDAIERTGQGSDVRQVATGRQAIDFLYRLGEFVSAPRPDLIFLDMQMPDMGGLDVLRRVKQDQQLREIPVVMMTGEADERLWRQAAGDGANSYIVKPPIARDLQRIMRQSLRYWAGINWMPQIQTAPYHAGAGL